MWNRKEKQQQYNNIIYYYTICCLVAVGDDGIMCRALTCSFHRSSSSLIFSTFFFSACHRTLASCSLACLLCSVRARLCPFAPALIWLVCRCLCQVYSFYVLGIVSGLDCVAVCGRNCRWIFFSLSLVFCTCALCAGKQFYLFIDCNCASRCQYGRARFMMPSMMCE